MIKLLEPSLPTADELLPWLRQIDANHWYSNFGPLERELTQALERHFLDEGLGAASLVLVSSATTALELAVRTLSGVPAPRVLMPALTFIASAQAVLAVGGAPVLADIDPDSWLLTPEIAERALQSGPIDMVMPVATFGCPVDVDAWSRFSQRHGIPVVIDAAGAFGGQSVGAPGVTVVFSFHATKVFSTAEGGALATTDPQLAESLRRRSNFGIGKVGQGVTECGSNAKLSEYHAAIGLASLTGWPERRSRLIALHLAQLQGIAGHALPVTLQARPAQGPYAIFPLLLGSGAERERVEQALTAVNIQHRRWYYPPVQMHELFQNVAKADTLTVTADVAERLLCIPYHLRLGQDDRQAVMKTLQAALA